MLFTCSSLAAAADTPARRWSKEKANQWHSKQPWLVGFNYIPSTAINQLDIWQAESFDPETIDRELGWAEELGFNTLRIFGHDVMWKIDAEGFKKRIGEFLDLCEKHDIRVIFTFFTNGGPGLMAKPGKQPEALPGVHMGAWYMSPGSEIVNHPERWGEIEPYVKDIISTFKDDDRILIWDLYNEPDKTKNGAHSLPLLRQVFKWARSVNPSQPLTSCMDNNKLNEFNAFLGENCDVITFHTYGGAKHWVNPFIKTLKDFDRPMLCTEYMGRTLGSTFEELMPIFKKERVGAISWGLVWGKTNTNYPWGSKPNSPEPEIWFHDILRPDGTPYDQEEVDFIKKMTADND